MFIPIVPIVPHTTIVNKNIVYTDTVLPLKDAGSNLKITSISDVGEYSLESCLKTIFESNPDVIFNTIQYSKSDKKIYFYTNAEISTKAWEDSNTKIHKRLTSSTEILEEVKRILLAEKNKDEECISLYDISQLMKTKEHQFSNMKDSYESHLENVINYKYSNSGIIVRDFDYDKGELVIAFRYSKDYDEIRFAKKDGDLYVSKSKSFLSNKVLAILGDILSKLYDEYIKYKDFEEQYKYGLGSANSNFLVDVSQHGVSIFTSNPSNHFLDDFRLSSYSYNNEWDYDCNSNAVISAFKGKENEIFKRIFVKISKCPKWSQPILYEIRQNQLEKEQRIENEQRNREVKKQKILEFKNKIFPFLKK